MLAAYKKNKKEIEKQGQASLALAKKRREDSKKRGLEASKANLSSLKQRQTSSNDPKGTPAASGAVSKGLEKRKDALSRQRKLDDLHNRSGQNGKISWSGLREKMNLAVSKQAEEYQRHPKNNPLQGYSYEEVCDMLDTLTEKEMEALQDSLGAKNENEVWDKINSYFTIGEN
jgi:hypothetical protein